MVEHGTYRCPTLIGLRPRRRKEDDTELTRGASSPATRRSSRRR